MDAIELAYEKIRSMEVRGAERIAIEAAKSFIDEIRELDDMTVLEAADFLKKKARYLKQARPTAAPLPNSINYIVSGIDDTMRKTDSLEEFKTILIKNIKKFLEKTKGASQKIYEIGARLIQDNDIILTHCHSSAVIGILKRAWDEGKNIKVVATETRPWKQGYITARELANANIPVTLIIDAAVRYMIKKARINKLLVGADCVTANGAIVNKIGTSQVALTAKEARVLVFVATQTLKFDPRTILGELEEIEERSPEEIVDPALLPNVTIKNPVFDVTPPKLIDLIITEQGVLPPQAVVIFIKEIYGISSFQQMDNLFHKLSQ